MGLEFKWVPGRHSGGSHGLKHSHVGDVTPVDLSGDTHAGKIDKADKADAATRFKIAPLSAKFDIVNVNFNRPFNIIVLSLDTQVPFMLVKVLNPKRD